MWGLAIRDGIGGLLESDDLLVEEGGTVVDERHGSFGLTDVSGAFIGLGDLSSVNVDLDGMLTDGASEEACCQYR